MRIALCQFTGQSHGGKYAGDAFLSLARCADRVNVERLTDLLSDAHAWVERAQRVLKDDLHRLALRPPFPRRKAVDRPAFEAHRAGRRLVEPEHQARDRRLAAAAFADERQRFSRVDIERDAVYRTHAQGRPEELPALMLEVAHETVGLQKRHAGHAAIRGWKHAVAPVVERGEGGWLRAGAVRIAAARFERTARGQITRRRHGAIDACNVSTVRSIRGIEARSPSVYGCDGDETASAHPLLRRYDPHT